MDNFPPLIDLSREVFSKKGDRMEFLLTTVNDWLKHAEGKHAVLIGLNAGIVGLIVNLLDFSEWSFSMITIYILWVITLMIASIIVSVTSYLPILNSSGLNNKNKTIEDKEPNPLFFVDVAVMEPKDLVQLFTDEDKLKGDIWIAEQIVINSRIAIRKYRLFENAVWLSFYAAFPPVALINGLIRCFFRMRRR